MINQRVKATREVAFAFTDTLALIFEQVLKPKDKGIVLEKALP